jgi:GTP cyclohydrolase II
MKTEASTILPTEHGNFLVKIYPSENAQESLAIISGTINPDESIAVRVHSSCITGEVLGSLKCDCKPQLDYALKYISEHGGVVIYLSQEGRGIGLTNKIKAYALQEQGYDTVDANRELGLADDARTYDDASEILSDLGINKIRLITNNPKKISSLTELGIEVCERIPLPLMPNPHSADYLETKRNRMGHLYESTDMTNK